MKIPIKDIQIGERQRVDLGDLSDLDSMRDLGQLQAVGLRRLAIPPGKPTQWELVFGRRRIAKAVELGWTDIEAKDLGHLSEVDKQEMELIEDIARKDRSWKEKCLAFAKLFRMKQAEKLEIGENWTIRMMSAFTNEPKTNVGYMLRVAEQIHLNPESDLAKSESFTDAVKIVFTEHEKEVAAELQKRRDAIPPEQRYFPEPLSSNGTEPGSPVTITEYAEPLTLKDRCDLYNAAFSYLNPPNTPLQWVQGTQGRDFCHAFWFVGGGNISDLYGSYQTEYLKRITTLFPDAKKVVHLFVGSLPPSPDYIRVGLPQGDTKPDFECDAHELSSKLPFKPDLIYADPPYSVEDSEHYQTGMINRARVMSECGEVLQDNGYLVWMDQSLPLFDGNKLVFVGCISYVRSTGNRFRCVCLFQKKVQAE